MNPSIYSLCRILCAGIAASSAALAPAWAQESKSLETVEVIGTRLKRTDFETPAPVRVITREDIRRSGAATLYELLSADPSVSGGGLDDTGQGTGRSSGTATVALRGFGSNGTLVLLNGRRMAASPYTELATGQSLIYNLNAIPLAAIERVEVLKSGASAIYGSDAVAGVVNIVLLQGYRGAQASTSFQFNQDGNFGSRELHGVVGFGDAARDGRPGYNGFLLFSGSRRSAVSVADTHGIPESELTRIYGRNTPDASTASYPPNYYREAVTGDGFFGTFVQRDARCPAELVLANGRCGHNAYQALQTIAPQESNSVMGRLDFPVDSALALFTEFGISRVKSTHTFGYVGVAQTGSTWFAGDGTPRFFQFILPPGHPDNPASVPVALRYRFQDIAPSSIGQTTDTGRLLLGAKGSRAGWEWESGLLYNRIDVDSRLRGELYFPALTAAIDSQAYRPFGNNSAATLAAISPELRGTGRSANLDWDLKASRELMPLAGGPMAVVLGTELRRERFKVASDPRLTAGDIVNYGGEGANAARSVGSLFAEVSAPFMKQVESQLAFRFDRYSDYGSSATPQFALKWKPADTVALRGGFAKGFQAPPLFMVGTSSIQGFYSGVVDPLRCEQPGSLDSDCGNNISTLTVANPDLKPERSNNWSAGLVLSPASNFDMSLDFYHITRTNEIAARDAQYTIDREAQFPGAVVRDSNPATWLPGVPNSGPIQSARLQYFNLGRTTANGVDLEATLRTRLGEWGSLKTVFSGGYIHKHKSRFDADSPYIKGQGGIGVAWALPRFKGALSTTWTYRDVELTGRVNHVGGWRYGDSSTDCYTSRQAYLDSYQCRISSWTTVDFLFRYTGIRNLELGFAIRNLLNKAAPLNPGNVTLGYDANFHNPYGRYFSLGLNYRF